jgi:AcrR family transcriptional regulator
LGFRSYRSKSFIQARRRTSFFFREEIHYNNINDEIRKKKTLNIQAAMKLFAQKGHHAASRWEIAEQCGMAKGSIYNYFKSKEEIAVSISL